MQKSDYEKYKSQDIKFWIIKILSVDSDYKVNDNILQMNLRDFGHNLSLNAINQHLSELEDVKLITLERLENLTLAKATRTGLDTVAGRLNSNIVRRPNPEEL